MSKNIGINIANRRKELGLTQTDLAVRMGYTSKSTIAKIEKGVNDISQTKVSEFAKALETTPAFLMGWEEDQQTKDELLEQLFRGRPDMKILFDATEDATPDEIMQAVKIIEALKK